MHGKEANKKRGPGKSYFDTDLLPSCMPCRQPEAREPSTGTSRKRTLPHCAVVLFLACLAEGEEGLPLQSLKKEVENGKPKKGNAKWEA